MCLGWDDEGIWMADGAHFNLACRLTPMYSVLVGWDEGFWLDTQMVPIDAIAVSSLHWLRAGISLLPFC